MLNQISNHPLLLVLLTVVITLAIIAFAIVVIPSFRKKGVNPDKWIVAADNVADTAATVINAADKIFPNNPVVNILKIIETWAKKAVGGAEQLNIASKLPADQRNAKAKDTIYTVLKTLGIEVTPEIEKIIDASIEAEVLALGHSEKSEDNNTVTVSLDDGTIAQSITQ